MYRWECETHREHGRWLKDGNMAQVFGTNHQDRRAVGPYKDRVTCHPRIKDQSGRDHGQAS